MKIVRILGCILMVIGLGAPVTSMFVPMNITPSWYLSVGVTVVSGIALFAGSFFGSIHLPHFSQTQSTTETDKKQAEVIPLEPSKLEQRDMQAIYYLSNRARVFNDASALLLLKELQDKFFENRHNVVKVGVTNEKTNSPAGTTT